MQAKTSYQSKWPSSGNSTNIMLRRMWSIGSLLENVNWYSHYGEQNGDSLKKTTYKTPYDPATPPPGIYPEKTTLLKDICTARFIATWFTIGKIWRGLSCPLTYKWIKKLWYIYTVEYYSAIQRDEFESVELRWTNLESVIQSEGSQKEITNIIYEQIYMGSTKMYRWTYLHGRSRDSDIENRLTDT